MQRYSGLIKDQQNALSLFVKTKMKLQKVINSFKDAHAESEKFMTEKQHEISEETEAQRFALAQIAAAEATIGKIDAIIS